MQNLVLFDDARHVTLLPLTYTRPVSELRVGILKIREKWERWFNTSASWLSRDYLREKYPMQAANDTLYINSGLLPDKDMVDLLGKLAKNQALVDGNTILAARADHFQDVISGNTASTEINRQYRSITHPYDIFALNGAEIADDFRAVTANRTSAGLNATNGIINKNSIFIEEGAEINYATINAGTGPVYIGKDAKIMEGATIRGPLALLNGSTIKMGAKIYGATTIGPQSKVGGEIKNVVIQGYSNKAHEGYLGDAVLGSWCNLGADTNNSNLKNNYAEVKLWNYSAERFVKTGLTFCGLIMGDHSKAGINTMFNTGTVVGVNANIYGDGFPRNFIPSFSWGGSHGFKTYKIDKALEVAEAVHKRKNMQFDEAERNILRKVFDLSAKYRQ